MITSTSESRSSPRAVAAVVALAAALRMLRVPARWDEVSWLYAAYPGDTVAAFRRGDVLDGLTQFTGQHPPLWGVLHAAQELLMPIPLVWLLTSALCSVGAVLIVARRSWVAGLLLATSPMQLAYAAEINDYPLAVLCIAAAWVSWERVRGGGSWVPLAIIGAAAAWTHALAGVMVGLLALALPGRDRWRVLSAMALSSAPLLPGVLDQLQDPNGPPQPPLRPTLIATDFVQRFGILHLALVPLVGMGGRSNRAAGKVLLACLGVILLALFTGRAAPHQFSYWLLLGPPVALLAARGGDHMRYARAALITLAIAQAAWHGGFNLVRLQSLAADPAGRAIDVAWAESKPGDAVMLLSPAGTNDDDKRRTSAVLWRLRPWWPMPMTQPYPFAYADHRHGQPRLVQGRTVYVHDAPRDTIERAVRAHSRLFLVVYDQGQRAAYTQDLRARLASQPEQIGRDLLFRLTPDALDGDHQGDSAEQALERP